MTAQSAEMAVLLDELRALRAGQDELRAALTNLSANPRPVRPTTGKTLTLRELLASGLLSGTGCASERSVHRAIREGRLRGRQTKPGAPWFFFENQVREDVATWISGGRVAQLLHG